MIDSRLQIAENQEDIAKAFEGVSEDLGYKVKVIYTDPSKSPQLIGTDKDGNTYIKDGTAYVDKDTGINYILINSESPANRTKVGVIGTIAEEQSHIIGKIEGRQKTVPDGSEKGLESLGRPTNDYFKNQYSKNDKAIGIVSDGRDYSNVGLKIGAGTGAAYGANSGTKNSNSKNTTNTAQENSNKNANPSNQRGQVSQSNKNNANKPKTEESNPDNQQANKIVTSNSQEEEPATKISTNQGIKMGNLTVYKDYVIGERGATYKLRGLTINGDKYYENNDSKYVIKNDKLVKIEATQVAEKFPTGDEKYYGRSEINILNEVNNTISNTEDKYKSQKSYYNRKEVPYGTKDSVRPEGRSDGLNRTIEVKKYDIDKNSSSMISKIVEQAKERDIHLPEGNTQEVYIDIRNQNVSLEKQEFIKNKIEKDSNGIIKKENIHFKK